MFCDRCAALTRELRFDPAAEPRADLITGTCTWPDEISNDWCTWCWSQVRFQFWNRYQLTLGESLSESMHEFWREAEDSFPEWPLLRAERRSPVIAPRVRGLSGRGRNRHFARSNEDCETDLSRRRRRRLRDVTSRSSFTGRRRSWRCCAGLGCFAQWHGSFISSCAPSTARRFPLTTSKRRTRDFSVDDGRTKLC